MKTFGIGERVCCAQRGPFYPQNRGVVVPDKKHCPGFPTIKWASGFCDTRLAETLRLMTAEEIAETPLETNTERRLREENPALDTSGILDAALRDNPDLAF